MALVPQNDLKVCDITFPQLIQIFLNTTMLGGHWSGTKVWGVQNHVEKPKDIHSPLQCSYNKVNCLPYFFLSPLSLP